MSVYQSGWVLGRTPKTHHTLKQLENMSDVGMMGVCWGKELERQSGFMTYYVYSEHRKHVYTDKTIGLRYSEQNSTLYGTGGINLRKPHFLLRKELPVRD